MRYQWILPMDFTRLFRYVIPKKNCPKFALCAIRNRRVFSFFLVSFLFLIIGLFYLVNWKKINGSEVHSKEAFSFRSQNQRVLNKKLKKHSLEVTRNTNAPIYIWNDKWTKDMDMCKDPGTRYRILPLKTMNGDIKLYAYNNSDYISLQIAKSAKFEPHIDEIIYYFLKSDPEINFIDIVANIGHRSLIVAHMGRRVLSVEALGMNVKLFCASVYLNMLENNVTIVNNAVGNNHEVIRMAKYGNSFGESFVDRKDMRDYYGKRVWGTFNEEVYTITFDDLLQLDVIQHFRKVFIKMDIEGFENKALEGAVSFFKKIEVVGIVMEWRFHREKASGAEIINIMQKNKFLPYRDNIKKLERLRFSIKDSSKWPHDVLWINSKPKNVQ